ncbi:uncharacterized protein LOC142242379 [Haematobia irritans]|uniref:uncharacterized protein LOC142242379 n=1 Tax=Haematobia irritans TaxID=7368 RepID=UPI003F504759
MIELLFLLLLGCVATQIEAQGSSYSNSYYSSGVSPGAAHYYNQRSGFVPLTYKSDLVNEESKHKLSKYAKKSYKGYGSEEEENSSERYSSDEYVNEARHPFLGKQQDSHEYTIGTHIHVQHPITIPKKFKASTYPTKTSKYSTLPSNAYTLDTSQETHGSSDYFPIPSKKQKIPKIYESDPFHVIAPPKSTVASHHSTTNYDGGYEPQPDSYENSETPLKHIKSSLRERFNGVASKKQIEQYLKDQEKLLDEALKLQLLSSPKFQKLLKTAEKENLNKEVDYEEEYISNGPPSYREPFPKGGPHPHSKRSRRRPPTSEFSRPIKPVVISKPNRKYRHAYVIEV